MIRAVADIPAQLEEVGRTIAGRYRVDAVLGRGGMGAVYRVCDSRTGNTLALKRGFARTPHKTSRRQTLLEREYHTLAQLAHPRIIEVYDYGVDELGPYYTMELLDGEDLDAGGKLPWQQACALLCDVASSLAILHSRGLLHRDVSARNVRCTADGHAKLIDFGAMTSIGVAKDTVGTPPFVAPEAMQMQALDARADLFALGALGYYLLTGRHAYHARRLSELRDVWRTRPRPPSRVSPDVPPALNALVMQLLALDRGTRPQSAAEVMERLCVVASLPRQESPQTSRAYLTMPTLVGRDQAMIATRRRMLSLARGDGGTLLIEGVDGSGRTRFLEACMLEGKLLGATVVLASVNDGENRDWGVARSLCTQLAMLLPRQASDAARLSHHVLSHVVDNLPAPAQISVSVRSPDRSLLIRELRDFVLSMARSQRLLVAVDDADRIDEPSLALLASLAHKTSRYPLILVLTVSQESRYANSPALRLLRSLSDPIELELLQSADTEALMRSVFGDVRGLPRLSARIHAHAHGSPRATMELAQHLVDRGIARYEAGSWLLPETLDDADIPSTLMASLSARLERLSADAHELCGALCLAESDTLSLDNYPALTDHCDSKRVFAALDELVAARILVADGERYHFSQRGFLAAVASGISATRRAAIHARLADLVSRTGGDPLRRAYHLLHGEHELDAIDLLCSIDLITRPVPLSLLEGAMLQAEQRGLPALTVHRLRMALLLRAPFMQEMALFRRYVPRVLERLSNDCGLTRYHQLADAAPSERLRRAVAETQEAYLSTPAHERVHGVTDAIRELTRVYGSACSVAVLAYDDSIELLPSLEPLLPLSPALRAVSQLGAAAQHLLRGAFGAAVAEYEAVLARISDAEHGGLDDTQYTRMHVGIHYLLGLVEAAMGMTSAEQRAHAIESDRELRVNAWRVRQLLYLNQGNVDEARTCQRRAELLQLQEAHSERYGGTSAAYELRAYSRIGDLLRVKATVEASAVMAERYAGWRPVVLFGQCRYLQLKGDSAGALALLTASFESVPQGRHIFWADLAAIHVDLLCELERPTEAVVLAARYLEIYEREQLLMTDHALHVAAAYAFARTGDHQRALAIIESVVESGERLGQSGLALGVLYEARARIAIWVSDRTTFEHFSERCAEQYNRAKNPALSGRIERLLEEAQKRDLDLGPLELAPQAHELIVSARGNTQQEIIYSRMRECVDDLDRGRCALSLLLQSTDSSAGYLYGVDEDDLKMLAALPEVDAEPGMSGWLKMCVDAELALDAGITGSGSTSEEEVASASDRFTDVEGRAFEAILLIAEDSDQPRIAAVLALHVRPQARTMPSRELRVEIADQLLEHGDVLGIALTPRVTARRM